MRRKERREKAEKLSSRWELLRICKQMMKDEGLNWKRSQERREFEMKERLEKEENERRRQEGIKVQLQAKITECWMKLPEERKKMIEVKEEKERRMLLKEAKEELWKRWRQNKGRKATNPEIKDREKLEDKLSRIEREVAEMEKSREKVIKERNEKAARLEKKRRKEQHWEMLKWIVAFLEDNQGKWNELRRKKEQDAAEQQKYEEWKRMDKEGRKAG